MALRLMGHRAVLTALSDTTTEGLACNGLIDECKKALLRMHPWNFAVKRQTIAKVNSATITAIGAAGGITELTVTNSYAVGEWLMVETDSDFAPVEGLDGGPYEISTATASVVGIILDFAEITGTFVSGLTYTFRTNPFGYLYSLPLPTDSLRVLAINETQSSEDWRIEGGRILTHTEPIDIRYIKDVTDYATMDSTFYQALANYLAYTLCDHLSASDGKKNELHVYLYGGQGKRGILPQARFLDANEDPPGEFRSLDWLESRQQGSNRGFVRDPGT
jgi:hypothetical protein